MANDTFRMANDTFRVGLVLAGTISAGAYSAGVIDFLLEALEAWEARKRLDEEKPETDRDPLLPRHTVKLVGVSGASGGAMTAAMLLRALVSKVEPANSINGDWPDPPIDDPITNHRPQANPFSAAWVQSIDLRHLLTARDLVGAKPKVVSILDSTVFSYIGANVLTVADSTRRLVPPNYVEDPFHAYFTTTNIRGVPYGFQFTWSGGDYSHQMSAYADYRHFQLTWQQTATPDRYDWELPPDILQAATVAPSGNWHVMIQSALASGAFPGGFAPRWLERKAGAYKDAKLDVPERLNVTPAPPAHRATQWIYKEPPVQWPPDITATSDYGYWNVDGGTMNNEPLALMHNRLAKGEYLARDGEHATGAIVMVDPFPNKSDVSPHYDDQPQDVVTTIKALLHALIEQTRFKPDELQLAADEDVYSRFVIAPQYQDTGAQPVEPAITAALLGGFGAFLSEKMRRHDFQLGRRNCQKFLRDTFCVLPGNPIVAAMAGGTANIPTFALRWTVKSGIKKTDKIPLIPLYDTAAIDIPLPVRPRAEDIDLDAIRTAITARYDAIVPKLCEQVPMWLLSKILRLGLSGVWGIGHRGEIVDAIMTQIKQELTALP